MKHKIKNSKVFIIIPAYNEEKTVGKVIEKAKRYCKNIVVVDDGSEDKTEKIAKQKGVYVLRHVINLGKGASVITGSEFAIKKGAKVLIYMDADLQHKAEDIPLFLDALKKADIVFGVRKLNKKMPLVLRVGNFIINKTIKLLYNIDIKDTQCGYRALKKETYEKIKWKSSDYSMESEMIANVGKKGIKYACVEIETLYPNKYKGTTFFHGMKIILDLFLWKLKNT